MKEDKIKQEILQAKLTLYRVLVDLNVENEDCDYSETELNLLEILSQDDEIQQYIQNKLEGK
jgi:hypothetical protein